MTAKVYLGIDPGLKDLGWALVTEDFSVIETGVINSFDAEDDKVDLVEGSSNIPTYGIRKTIWTLSNKVLGTPPSVEGTGMERFVSYADKQTALSEPINILIGGLLFTMPSVYLCRASDWKIFLGHHLLQTRGWRNPSSARDKDMSFALCKEFTGKVPATSHEADAICLAITRSLKSW